MRPCNWYGCEKDVPESMEEPFCGAHWHSLTQADKATLKAAYGDYRAGTIDHARLAEVVAGVLKTYQRRGKP